MKWSSFILFGALATALAPRAARAGACCVGSTSATPAILGECERVAVGVIAGAERSVGRYDAEGRLATSSLEETALTGSLGLAARWARWGQVALTLPGRYTWRAAGELTDRGGGPMDAAVVAVIDPLIEVGAAPGSFGLPTPVLTLGARAPTGRSWEASSGVLQADVTGATDPAALVGLTLERTLGQTPWSLGWSAAVPLGDDGVELAASAMVGRYVGPAWTVMGAARHAWEPAFGTRLTTVGARVVHGRARAWRVWGALDGPVPVPALGRAADLSVAGSAGFALVR